MKGEIDHRSKEEVRQPRFGKFALAGLRFTIYRLLYRYLTRCFDDKVRRECKGMGDESLSTHLGTSLHGGSSSRISQSQVEEHVLDKFSKLWSGLKD